MQRAAERRRLRLSAQQAAQSRSPCAATPLCALWATAPLQSSQGSGASQGSAPRHPQVPAALQTAPRLAPWRHTAQWDAPRAHYTRMPRGVRGARCLRALARARARPRLCAASGKRVRPRAGRPLQRRLHCPALHPRRAWPPCSWLGSQTCRCSAVAAMLVRRRKPALQSKARPPGPALASATAAPWASTRTQWKDRDHVRLTEREPVHASGGASA